MGKQENLISRYASVSEGYVRNQASQKELNEAARIYSPDYAKAAIDSVSYTSRERRPFKVVKRALSKLWGIITLRPHPRT